MIQTRTFNTIPDFYVLWHASLHGARVLSVDRLGMGQDESSVIMVENTEFYHTSGFIVFTPAIPFTNGEKVQIIYET